MLAIVDCMCDQWREYCEGAKNPITVYTDHNNLQTFNSLKKLSRRQARWAEKLSNFDFKIIYRKRKANAKADALSRRGDHALEKGSGQRDQQGVEFWKEGTWVEEEIMTPRTLASLKIVTLMEEWKEKFI